MELLWQIMLQLLGLQKKVSKYVADNVLYLPIADPLIKNIQIRECEDKMIDLLDINEPRLKPMSSIDTNYHNPYEGYSKVRYRVRAIA